jgi:predicted metal-binding protein
MSTSSDSWLKVCVTCDPDGPESARRPLLGEILAARIESGLRHRGLSAALELRRVQCLASCQHPSTVVFGAIGKCKLRLHDIGCADTEAILTLAEAYVLSPDGEPAVSTWPDHLRKRLVSLVRPQIRS